MYGYGYGYGIDWTYIILVLPAVIFSLWASARVNSTFRRYQGQYARNGLTGAEAARAVLERNGVYDVRIERVGGSLTDHYDPSANVIRLSESVYGSCSTAAIGVACHEAGHAVQHAEHYLPASIRSAIVPVTNIGSRLSMPLIVLGIIFSSFSYFFVYVAYAGVLCFGWVGEGGYNISSGLLTPEHGICGVRFFGQGVVGRCIGCSVLFA